MMGVEVEIFGQKFLIKGDDNDPEYIKTIASYVDSKMREVHGKLHRSTPVQVAFLTAMNIAHELFSLKKEKEEQECQITDSTERLLELLSLEFKT